MLRRIDLVSRDTQRQTPEATYRIGGSAVFEPSLHRIVDSATCVALTPTQSHILQLLCAYEGQAVSTERIVSHLGDGATPR
jgi:DNA-binding response OmpR family regulator